MDPALYELKLKRAKRRLALRRFILGRSHPRTGDAYFEAGTLSRLAGNVEAAAHCLSMAEQIHRRRLGPGHPAVALDLFSIGEYQSHWGERRRALQSYERAQQILEGNLRKNPEARFPEPSGTSLRHHLGYLLCNMGQVHRDLDQHGKARACYEQAMRIFLDDPGPGSEPAVDVARRLVALGVDPIVAVREHAGESAASALRDAYVRVHATEPAAEPMA